MSQLPTSRRRRASPQFHAKRCGIVAILATCLQVAIIVAMVVLRPGSAHAHTLLFSQSEFEWGDENVVHAVLVFNWQDAVSLSESLAPAPGAGRQDGGRGSDFEAVIASGVDVRADDQRCAGRLEDARPYQGDAFLFLASFVCPHRPNRLRVVLPLLRALPAEHRHLIQLRAEQASVETTLSVAQDSCELAFPPRSVGGFTERENGPEPRQRPFFVLLRSALGLGLRHIVTGWDHLLFLVAVAFGVPRLRSAILPISSFTVAHTVTLACAAFGVLVLSPRIVEPAIAASIAYLALENVFVPSAPHRWVVTFAFGLVHGLGFATALTDLAVDRARLVPMLLGFNVGIELGQLGFLAIVLPAVLWLRASNRRIVTQATCLAIFAIAGGLCVARLFAT